jgi:hypothetical protein
VAAVVGTVLLIVSSGGRTEAPATAAAVVTPVIGAGGAYGLGAALTF